MEMAEFNNPTTYELNMRRDAWHNLEILLRQDISREQFLADLRRIEENNDPDADCIAFIENVMQQLESKEPNQLPSFDLLQKLAVIKMSVEEYASVSSNKKQALILDGMVADIETSVRRFLPTLYGMEGRRILINFTSRVTRLQFLRLVVNRRELDDESYHTSQRLINELLDLWKQIPLTEEMEEERELLREILAPKPRS
jgi:hypothetical protein